MGVSGRKNPIVSPRTNLEAWLMQGGVWAEKQLYPQTPQSRIMHIGLQASNVSVFSSHFSSSSSSSFSWLSQSLHMEEKYSFLYAECNFPSPEVHSLWTGFGWTSQSSLKREPFPTVLWESSPFEVTAGLTKLISSIHNVLLMQCWPSLPLAGSCYWTRPKCNV